MSVFAADSGLRLGADVVGYPSGEAMAGALFDDALADHIDAVVHFAPRDTDGAAGVRYTLGYNGTATYTNGWGTPWDAPPEVLRATTDAGILHLARCGSTPRLRLPLPPPPFPSLPLLPLPLLSVPPPAFRMPRHARPFPPSLPSV